MELRFSNDIRTAQHGEYIAIGNEKTGHWIKLTKECYDIIRNAVLKQWSSADLVADMSDQEDRQYMVELIERLQNMRIIVSDEDTIENTVDNVTFCITNRCNLRCHHCSVSASSDNSDYLSESQTKRAIDSIVKCKPSSLTISGGEPLVRRDFQSIIDYVRSVFGGKLYLMTNGTLINEKEAKFIAERFDNVSISLDGYDEKTTDFIRGQGAFIKAIRGIENLKKAGFKDMSTSMILSGNNRETIDRFKKLNNRMGTKPVFRTLAMVGRAENNGDLLLDSEEGAFLRGNREKDLKYNGKEKKRIIGTFTVCNAIENQFCIGADGTIFPCAGAQLTEFSLGNIREIRDLSFFFQSGEYKETGGYKAFIRILPRYNSRCKDCHNNLFCFGCPVYHYVNTKQGIFDKFCDEQMRLLNECYWEMDSV